MQWNQHVVKMIVIKQSKQLYVSLIYKRFANVIYGMDNKHLKKSTKSDFLFFQKLFKYEGCQAYRHFYALLHKFNTSQPIYYYNLSVCLVFKPKNTPKRMLHMACTYSLFCCYIKQIHKAQRQNVPALNTSARIADEPIPPKRGGLCISRAHRHVCLTEPHPLPYRLRPSFL